jgi:tRNA A-37 threonylcarbamoyl transferase component Bud32
MLTWLKIGLKGSQIHVGFIENGFCSPYTLVDGHYLVIEFIHGTPYRQAVWTDRGRWFNEFLAVLRSIHQRGVSHGDLKSKSNIMVTEDEKPCVIDFGTGFVRKPGSHPANNWLFEHGKREYRLN